MIAAANRVVTIIMINPSASVRPNDKLTGVRALSHVRLSDLLGNFGFYGCSKSVVVDRIYDSPITVCPIPEASLQDKLLDWAVETG
jgi:hypothetical protein